MKLRSKTPADILLRILLATDILLIVVHVLFLTTAFVHDDNYSILAERGFGETFQYFKAFWLVLMFTWIVLLTREKSYLAWAAVFGYLGLDDLMEIHEEVGNDLAIRYEFTEMLGQRPRDIGEMVIFGIAGVVLISILAVAYWRSSEDFRKRGKTLAGLSALLIFFGIGIDAVHIHFLDTIADEPLGLLEDGGEMIVLSVVCWYVFRLLLATHAAATNAEEDTTEHSARKLVSTSGSDHSL